MLLMSSKEGDAGGSLTRAVLRKALETFRKKHRAHRVQIIIDVDPASIM
jgi:hypothetical protein